jgi:hypothetical protein
LAWAYRLIAFGNLADTSLRDDASPSLIFAEQTIGRASRGGNHWLREECASVQDGCTMLLMPDSKSKNSD